jgi:uncharacterized protein YdhG (YjbR/CyaY superfamily)
MNRRKAAKSPKSGKNNTATGKTFKGFSDEERVAMRERIQELKDEMTGRMEKEGERIVLTRIDGMPEPDRTIGRRIHSIIRAGAPTLLPRLWYGMPAYAKEGNIVCYFQPAHKFKARYATLGFSDKAKLDEGNVWPVAFALRRLTAVEEAKIAAFVKSAVG